NPDQKQPYRRSASQTGSPAEQKELGTSWYPTCNMAPCYNGIAMKSQLKRYLGSLVFVFLLCLAIALGATAGVLFVYNSDLPQVNSLEDYHPSLITEVKADDGQVIGSFALERRIVVSFEQIPKLVKDAIISVEDQNFYTHWGIDIYGVARAGLKDLMAGRFVEGG